MFIRSLTILASISLLAACGRVTSKDSSDPSGAAREPAGAKALVLASGMNWQKDYLLVGSQVIGEVSPQSSGSSSSGSSSGSSSSGSTGSSGSESSATFLKEDSATQGNWYTAYGADGFLIESDSNQPPSYGSVGFTGANQYTWATSTSDPRALENGAMNGRIASCWYQNPSYTIDLDLTDALPHTVAFYSVDWDTTSRRQTFTITDATSGAQLDSRSLNTSYNGGVYLVWTITGHVHVNLTTQAGLNAVVSGVFFGGPKSASGPAPAISSQTQAFSVINSALALTLTGSNFLASGNQVLLPCVSAAPLTPASESTTQVTVSVTAPVAPLNCSAQVKSGTQASAAYGPFMLTSPCVIQLTTCPNYPTYAGAPFADLVDTGSAASQTACTSRIWDYYDWCGSDAPITATYYTNGNPQVTTRTTVCRVQMGQSCPAQSAAFNNNATFVDDYNNASDSQPECMQRATDYLNSCGSGASPVTTSYYSNGTLLQSTTASPASAPPPVISSQSQVFSSGIIALTFNGANFGSSGTSVSLPCVSATPLTPTSQSTTQVTVTFPAPPAPVSCSGTVTFNGQTSAPFGPFTITAPCVIQLTNCPANPTAVPIGTPFADPYDPASAASASACEARVWDYINWCGTDSPITVTYYVNGVVAATQAQSTICRIETGLCPAEASANPWSVNAMFVDNWDNASESQSECMQRATDYYEWCGTGATPVTAAYYSNSAVVQSTTGGGNYQGCYADSSTGARALPNLLIGSNATIQSCLEAAQSNGYAYAGLQYEGQCFAGNVLQYAPSANCTTPCSANPAENCGGSWANAVWATGIAVTSPAPSISSVSYDGVAGGSSYISIYGSNFAPNGVGETVNLSGCPGPVTITYPTTSQTNSTQINVSFPTPSSVANCMASVSYGGQTSAPSASVRVAPAVGGTNFALASNGATISSSGDFSASYPASSAIIGSRYGDGSAGHPGWGGGGGWNSSNSPSTSSPASLQVDFDQTRTISEIDVFTLQDNFSSPVNPVIPMPFTTWGIQNFTVQYWNGAGWTTVPGGVISGNNQVWTQLLFAPVTTTQLLVTVTGALGGYARIVDLEAYGPTSQVPPSSPQYLGCYSDQDVRALPVMLAGGGATVETCTAAAFADGYLYAGLQYGGQCFAGNVLGYSAKLDSNCNMPCSANPGETCGGSLLNSIWSTTGASLPGPSVTQAYYAGVASGLSYVTIMGSGFSPTGAGETVTLTGGTGCPGSVTIAYPTSSSNNSNQINVLFPATYGDPGGLRSCTVTVGYNSHTASAPQVAVVPDYWPVSTTNLATTSIATANSFGNDYGPLYPASSVLLGNRAGNSWGNGGGWGSGNLVSASSPATLQVVFNTTRSINEIDLFTVQDNWSNPQQPVIPLPFTLYGMTNFTVQYQTTNGAWLPIPGGMYQNSSGSWTPVSSGSISNTNQIWTQLSFAPVTATAIQVIVTGAASAGGSYARITDIEAYGQAALQPSGVPTFNSFTWNGSGATPQTATVPGVSNYAWSVSGATTISAQYCTTQSDALPYGCGTSALCSVGWQPWGGMLSSTDFVGSAFGTFSSPTCYAGAAGNTWKVKITATNSSGSTSKEIDLYVP